MSIRATHCALRLGDNLAALHFLRKLAIKYPDETFVHYAHPEYLPQLVDVVADLTNVGLGNLPAISQPGSSKWTLKPHPEIHSVDTWKNAEGFWESHPLKWDYGPFMVAFYLELARRMNLESPIKTTRNLLFDFPALKPAKPPCEPFDFLIVNSEPQSGQFRHYNDGQFEELIAMLARKYHVVTTQRNRLNVTCTETAMLNITQIGHLSQFCKAIIMVATGPSWLTFNPWNAESVKLRVILSDNETVNLAPHTIHTNKVYAVRDILMSGGYL